MGRTYATHNATEIDRLREGRGPGMPGPYKFPANSYCTLPRIKIQPFSTGFTRLTQTSPAAAHPPASQWRAARGRACAPI